MSRRRARTGRFRLVPCVAAIAATAIWLARVPEADAHLRRIGESLLAILARSDTLVLAQATAATQDERDASGRLERSWTPFALRGTIAGVPPEERFSVVSPPPALRYAARQVAIVGLAREPASASGATWGAVQGPGAGLLATSPVEDRVYATLTELWRTLHAGRAASASASTAELLARLLDATPRRLALLAAFDLADLAHGGPLPSEAVRTIRDRLADPALQPELRPLLEHALEPAPLRPRRSAAGASPERP